MKIAKIVLASCAALTLIGSAAFAQQATTEPEWSRSLTVSTVLSQFARPRTAPSAPIPARAIEFKVKGVSLENVHAGDRVKYSATEADGAKTITKIEKQ